MPDPQPDKRDAELAAKVKQLNANIAEHRRMLDMEKAKHQRARSTRKTGGGTSPRTRPELR